ncbi:MAG: MepB family protein [Gammaproteobacteria bacterium]|nr:MepB family protein [Gammaproteobacteria bacterium]
MPKERSKALNNKVLSPALRNIPSTLVNAISSIYEPASMQVTKEPVSEVESSEYGASRFSLDDHSVVFREAKTTPTKIGQFVTIWSRPVPGGEIAPLDSRDNVDFVVINTSDEKNKGQFVFDRDVLIKKGVMSLDGVGGKRAIRIYPPWTQPVANDAIRTQKWQGLFFFRIEEDGTADTEQVRRLFKCAPELDSALDSDKTADNKRVREASGTDDNSPERHRARC